MMIKALKQLQDRWFRINLFITSDPYRVADLWRKQGANIGEGTCVYRDALLPDGQDQIWVGKDCVLTGCMILAHDASTNKLLGLKYGQGSIIQAVVIEDNCFIGYHAIILMGVKVGKGSIVGAGAVVTHDVPPGCVVAGNPARVICTVDELVKKRIDQIRANPGIFSHGYENFIFKIMNER
jgi:acetyltransferase-like isoleucine patch superfamily enzyme